MQLIILILLVCFTCVIILEEYKNQLNPVPLMNDEDKSFEDIPNYKTRNMYK